MPSRQHQSLIITTSSIGSCSFPSSSVQCPHSNTTPTHHMHPRFIPALPSCSSQSFHLSSSQQSLSCPHSSHPLPPVRPFVHALPHPHSSSIGPLLPGSQSHPKRSISSTLMQEKVSYIHPVSSISSSSSLLFGQHFQRPTMITGTTLQHTMHTTLTNPGTQGNSNTLKNVAPLAGTSLVQTLRTPQQAVITNQGPKNVRLSSLASTLTPRPHHTASTTLIHTSVLPGQGAPMGRGQQRPQGLQQSTQEQQQRYKFGMWKTPSSPSRRRIRFNETAEVLGTPDSTDRC